MSPTPPSACTLEAADMPRRAADIRALGRDALVDVERAGPRATLRFRRDPATRARLEAIVDAESKCCAFLDFGLSYAGDVIVLRLEAPAGAEAAIDTLADLFAAERPRFAT